jgi:hypothetical protein
MTYQEYIKLQKISIVLGIVMFLFLSPLILGSLNAHKNPDLNMEYLNGQTGQMESRPVPIEYRIFMALIFCIGPVLMCFAGPIVCMIVGGVTDRGIEFITGRKQ